MDTKFIGHKEVFHNDYSIDWQKKFAFNTLSDKNIRTKLTKFQMEENKFCPTKFYPIVYICQIVFIC